MTNPTGEEVDTFMRQLVGKPKKAAPLEQYSVLVWALPEQHGRCPDEKWQADCRNDHARGTTPGQAVDRLVQFIAAKAKAEE